MKSIKKLFLACALCLCVSSLASAQLPPEVQADLLQEKIVSSLQMKDYSSVKSQIAEYQELDIAIPPAILLIDAKIETSEKNWVSAKSKLELYFSNSGKSHGSYQEALGLYKTTLKELENLPYELAVAEYRAGNYDRALMLYRKACNAEIGNGCYRAADMHHYGQGYITEDKKKSRPLYHKAIEAYKKACENGNLQSCIDEGDMYGKTFLTGIENEARAKSLYLKACNGGYMAGCVSLGWYYKLQSNYKTPASVRRSQDIQAAVLFKKACNADEMRGCYSLASSYKDGEGVVKDESRAKALFRKACDGGNGGSCQELKYGD